MTWEVVLLVLIVGLVLVVVITTAAASRDARRAVRRAALPRIGHQVYAPDEDVVDDLTAVADACGVLAVDPMPTLRGEHVFMALGGRAIHRRCKDHRRDGRPDEICQDCRPFLHGSGAGFPPPTPTPGVEPPAEPTVLCGLCGRAMPGGIHTCDFGEGRRRQRVS